MLNGLFDIEDRPEKRQKDTDAAAVPENQSATLANGWECFLRCPTCCGNPKKGQREEI